MTFLIIALFVVFLHFRCYGVILLLRFFTYAATPHGKHLACSVLFISVWNAILKILSMFD